MNKFKLLAWVIAVGLFGALCFFQGRASVLRTVPNKTAADPGYEQMMNAPGSPVASAPSH